MREFREGEPQMMDEQAVPEEEATFEQPEHRQPFARGGEIPPVSENTAFEPGRTASSWAYDGEQQAPKTQPGGRQTKERHFPTGNGTYTVTYELVKLPRPDKGGGKQDAMKARIVFTPNELVKSNRIGFVQVVRRSENGGADWATKENKKGMTEQRAKRTDEKTGFRVDREDNETSPFYGTTYNDNNDLEAPVAESNRIGRVPMMTDRPWITPNNHVEFVATATDIDTGKQFDAIRWGFQAGASSVDMIEPQLVAGDDEALIGRDRAIHKWNQLADQGADEDALPTENFDPVEDAQVLERTIQSKSVGLIRSTLEKHGTDRGRRSKVKRHYRFETGRELSTDLTSVLEDKDEKKFKDWL